ncbi:JmjC domain-containing protein [Herbaspirillum sp. YR522]|uniref:JmjC domain-containing protein n=1 Tax=Herbaspirillum sp. YR522 TaxID=1144342 RepID=UPI00026F64CD|nr:cupin domain-containing protein [Herbaspirillum sp. YR522]EJN09336.1 Cupin superfamily protein [Herbaspirillum sp. YR522]
MSNDFVDWLLKGEQFQSCYSTGSFWLGRYPAAGLPAIFSWDRLNDCLTCNRITNDRLRLSTAQQYEQFNKRVFRATRDAFGRPTDHLLIHELQAVMGSGVTAVLEAVNELTRPLAEMTQCLACALDVRSAANAYMSFGLTSGFGVHHDDHDVIIIQIDGRKKWQFFSLPDANEKATVADLEAPTESDRGQSVIIHTGDVMFIPKGTWHDVTAMNERSLHLTISLVNPTLLDFAQWMLKKQGPLFSREDIRRNPAFCERSLALFRDAWESLCNPNALQDFLRHYHASHTVSPIEATFPTLHCAQVDDRFRRTTSDVVLTQEIDGAGKVTIFASGRTHRLTQDEYALLLALPCGWGEPGSALLVDGRQWSDIAPVLTSLMDKGLVGKRVDARASC